MHNPALEIAIADDDIPRFSRQEMPRGPKPLLVRSMAEIVETSVDWLWRPYLARGTFSIIEGQEGIGKTFILCALATAISKGHGLPFVSIDQHLPAANVLFFSAEDSLSAVLKPRLRAMGADMDRVFACDEPFSLDREGITRMEKVIADVEPVAVFIDPLFSYTGRINLNNDNEIRTVTDAIKIVAETHGTVIAGVRHIGKSKGMGDPRSAGLNGIGWRAAARSVLLVGQDAANHEARAICQTKNNLGEMGSSIGYKVDGGSFFWTGATELTSESLLTSFSTESSEEKSEKNAAMGFLRELLSGGGIPAPKVFEEAKRAGFAEKTVRRAQKALGITSEKEKGKQNGGWAWVLPKREDGHIHSIDHLPPHVTDNQQKINDLTEGGQDGQDAHVLDVKNEVGHLPIRGNIQVIRSRCDCGAYEPIDLPCPKCGVIIEDAAAK